MRRSENCQCHSPCGLRSEAGTFSMMLHAVVNSSRLLPLTLLELGFASPSCLQFQAIPGSLKTLVDTSSLIS